MTRREMFKVLAGGVVAQVLPAAVSSVDVGWPGGSRSVSTLSELYRVQYAYYSKVTLERLSKKFMFEKINRYDDWRRHLEMKPLPTRRGTTIAFYRYEKVAE